MYLYHYTNIHDVESIVEKGMLFGSELNDIDYGYGTGPINGVLRKYKPANLPDFIHRDKCIFFYPKCMYRDFGNTEIKINSEKLPKEKLFVADLGHAQQIWNDTVDASYSGETSGIPLSKSAKSYWNSLILFDEYAKNPSLIRDPEVLYFGKIPFDLLEVTTTLHPLAQKIFGHMLKNYRVKRWGSTYGEVYMTEKQFFKINLNPFLNKTSLYSKSGQIDEQAIEHFETNFSFKEKEVKKDGNQMKVTYRGIEEKIESLKG